MACHCNWSSLYTNVQHLMLFGGCGGDNPTGSNQLYNIQSNWQLQASNWLFRGNATMSATAGQVATMAVTAVVSQSQPTPLLFARALTLGWFFRWQVVDGDNNAVLIQPTLPGVTDLGGGQYSINYTVLQGRTATLSVQYYELIAATFIPVTPSSFTITIAPGPYAPHTPPRCCTATTL